ncbi:TPA: hypothetical protein ACXIF1_006601, partial [Pseudomonas aeruginosa]
MDRQSALTDCCFLLTTALGESCQVVIYLSAKFGILSIYKRTLENAVVKSPKMFHIECPFFECELVPFRL